MRWQFIVPASFLLFALACAGGSRIGTEEVANFGTKRFAAPADKVIAATSSALQSMGYEVAMQNPDKGLIQTNRKYIRTDVAASHTRWSSSAVGIVYTRQYMIRVVPVGDEVEVSAVPRVFQNDVEISEQAVWDMNGETALWRQLFSEIDNAL